MTDTHITNKQWDTIHLIENSDCYAPKFDGTTKQEASAYIEKWIGEL